MLNVWLYTIIAVSIVSALSLVGVFTLVFKEEQIKKLLLYLVSFSAGVLLGDVFLHIFPEMAQHGFGVREGFYFLSGILVFFILERAILWHHSHTDHEEQVHSVVYMTLAGDALHNFIDGLVIASSFLVSIPLGIAATIAVAFHEIPHEIGNFAVLLHGGWKAKKALYYNFLSALTAIAGALVVLVFAKPLQGAPTLLLSFGGASFIYIALSDLVPELHKDAHGWRSMLQFLCFILGVGFMSILLVSGG